MVYPGYGNLLSLELVLLDGESHLQELLLLLLVHALQTTSDGGARVTASVHDVLAVVVLGLVEQGLNARLRETPGTSVERLLLAPDDGLGVGVLVEVLAELLPGEGVELLDTGEGDVVDLVVGAVLVQGGVDLTRAQDDTLNLLGLLDVAGLVLGVSNHGAEASVRASEVLDAGAGDRVTQERLGEEDDKGCIHVSI